MVVDSQKGVTIFIDRFLGGGMVKSDSWVVAWTVIIDIEFGIVGRRRERAGGRDLGGL